jgi:riboflavin kinase/FMN adenylyltransferase
LFDFSADIYGQHVQVHFLYKVRDEQRFNSLEELKLQIEKDCVDARRFLLLSFLMVVIKAVICWE